MSDIKSRWRSSAGIVQARKLVSQTQLTPALVFLFALVFLLALPSWRSSQQPSYAERISPASANVAAQEQQHSDVGRGSARASPCPALPAMISRSTDADLAMGTDPKLPAAFFLPRTYAQRYNNSYDPEPASAERITSWQYQVYESARALAVQLKPPAIIDVGCGSGVKLAKLRDVAESLYCLDFGDNLANVAKDFPFIKPIEIDLNKDIRTLIPRSTLRDAIVINADNIEHVGSAIDLIGAFGVWMQDAAVLLLSTPDRVRHGFSPAGPPPNKAHVRDLTLCEMVTLISKHGPRIAAAGWTENHTCRGSPSRSSSSCCAMTSAIPSFPRV